MHHFKESCWEKKVQSCASLQEGKVTGKAQSKEKGGWQGLSTNQLVSIGIPFLVELAVLVKGFLDNPVARTVSRCLRHCCAKINSRPWDMLTSPKEGIIYCTNS